MNYYKLSNYCTDPSEMGTFPQLAKWLKRADWEKVYSGIEGELPNNWQTPIVALHPKAKLTTQLTGILLAPVVLTLKKSFVKFLQDFDLPPHKTWPIHLVHRDQDIHDYLLFHISDPIDYELIDIEKSSFYAAEGIPYGGKLEGELIQIKDAEEYKRVKLELKYENSSRSLYSSPAVFDFDRTTYDLIRMTNEPHLGYFVSQKLKDAIEEYGVTGIGWEEMSY